MSSPLIPGSIAATLLEGARRLGVYAIVREQEKRVLSITVQNGRIEEIGSAHSGGAGFHLFAQDGRSAFGCSDGFGPEEALEVLRSTAAAAAAAGALGDEGDRAIFSAAPLVLHLPDERAGRFDDVSLERLKDEALASHEQVRALASGIKVQTGVTVQREDWRISRSDGTAASWSVPRFVLNHAVTAEGAGGSLTLRTHLFSPDYDALSREGPSRLLAARSRAVTDRALGLRTAGRYPAGSYPILIDYALAKGLAHEAFGHAAEADSFRSSVLARDGRFRSGERVGRDGVSVIDEPVRGDHAYQPIGANGFRRERVEIVKSGVLHEALADLFSAGPGGVPVKGAERAESYRSTPIPRMSNIRIEMASADPLPRPFEEMTPGRRARPRRGGGTLRAAPEDRVPLGLHRRAGQPGAGRFRVQLPGALRADPGGGHAVPPRDLPGLAARRPRLAVPRLRPPSARRHRHLREMGAVGPLERRLARVRVPRAERGRGNRRMTMEPPRGGKRVSV